MSLTMAKSLDVESLLFEARELLRDLCSVSRAQSAEIERLGGGSWDGARELQESASAAVNMLQDALDRFALGPAEDESESEDEGLISTSLEATIQQWRAKTRELQEDTAQCVGKYDYTDEFPIQDEAHDDEEAEVGETSFLSATSSFWRPSGLKWADEADEDEYLHDSSGSVLNVPELLDDSGRFDSASDSGDSFCSADMLAHSGAESDGGKTVEVEVEADEPTPTALDHRRFPRGRTVSFNVLASYDINVREPTKASPASAFPKSILSRKSVPHLHRLARMESLPEIGRLIELQE